jgi:hypothetical protein
MIYSAISLLFLGLGLAPLSSLALIHGIDSSALVNEVTYEQFKEKGFTKAIILGYEEACGTGGGVDPTFVGSYNSARLAGFTNIDTAWFPCTGSIHSCKSFSDQIAELGAVFKTHNMDIGTIWRLTRFATTFVPRHLFHFIFIVVHKLRTLSVGLRYERKPGHR